MASQDAEDKLPKLCVLTKKRYQELIELFKTMCHEENFEQMKSEFERIMSYDPMKKHYTREKGRQIMESRKKRAAELGISVQEYRSGRWKNTAERVEA